MKLSIQKPCGQRWQDFVPTEGGAFCDSCRQTVVDFTRMSDDAIVSYFQQKRGATCGRFHPGQLTSYMQASARQKPHRLRLKAVALTLLLAWWGKNATAQSAPAKPDQEQSPLQRANAQSDNRAPAAHEVRGVMVDDEKLPLPAVNIMLKGSTVGTTSDAHGRFVFPQKLQAGDVLVCTFIGYMPTEYKVPSRVAGDLEVVLMCRVDIMGKVAVEGVYQHERRNIRNAWSRLKSWF